MRFVQNIAYKSNKAVIGCLTLSMVLLSTGLCCTGDITWGVVLGTLPGVLYWGHYLGCCTGDITWGVVLRTLRGCCTGDITWGDLRVLPLQSKLNTYYSAGVKSDKWSI